MELIDKLKQKVENAAGKEEAEELMEETAMKLADDQLGKVSGGGIPEMMGLAASDGVDKDSPWSR